jgi:hypothetical protein
MYLQNGKSMLLFCIESRVAITLEIYVRFVLVSKLDEVVRTARFLDFVHHPVV